MNLDSFEKIIFITNRFFCNSKVFNIYFLDSGLINKTYIVEHLNDGKKAKFILQCLSDSFESNEIVNINHKFVTDHVKNTFCPKFDNQRWEVPSLIRCKYNNLFLLPFASDYWRAMEYINDTFCVEILEDKFMAYQTGRGLAKFHLSCYDLEVAKLKNSIKNFHNTKHYIDQFEMLINAYEFNKLENKINKRVQKLIINLSNHILHIKSILRHLKDKLIDLRLIHGDPKLSNFLFDIQNKNVVSLIDLDTVSSGYLLTDLSDCIRSISNIAGEDPDDIDDVHFDINCCEYFLRGYFSISNQEGNHYFSYLPESIYLIIVELSMRFINDFLESNTYFKTKYQSHNLYRAEVQLRLLLSYISQLPALTNVLNEIGISSNPNFVDEVQKIV